MIKFLTKCTMVHTEYKVCCAVQCTDCIDPLSESNGVSFVLPVPLLILCITKLSTLMGTLVFYWYFCKISKMKNHENISSTNMS